MSSSKLYVIDSKRRIQNKQVHYNYRFNKYLSNDLALPFGLKIYARNMLFLSILDGSKVRIQNRCIYTYRSKSVYRQFKLARSQLRETIWRLLIPGTCQTSW